MALVARDTFGADWILNGDAGEFWHLPTGNLKGELGTTSANLILCERRNMIYTYDGDERAPWPARITYRASPPVPFVEAVRSAK